MAVEVEQLREALKLVDQFGGAEALRELLVSIDVDKAMDPYACMDTGDTFASEMRRMENE